MDGGGAHHDLHVQALAPLEVRAHAVASALKIARCPRCRRSTGPRRARLDAARFVTGSAWLATYLYHVENCTEDAVRWLKRSEEARPLQGKIEGGM